MNTGCLVWLVSSTDVKKVLKIESTVGDIGGIFQAHLLCSHTCIKTACFYLELRHRERTCEVSAYFFFSPHHFFHRKHFTSYQPVPRSWRVYKLQKRPRKVSYIFGNILMSTGGGKHQLWQCYTSLNAPWLITPTSSKTQHPNSYNMWFLLLPLLLRNRKPG